MLDRGAIPILGVPQNVIYSEIYKEYKGESI